MAELDDGEAKRKAAEQEIRAREALAREDEERASSTQASAEVEDDDRYGTPGFSSYRPLESLNRVDYSKLKNNEKNPEKELVKEALRGEVLGMFLPFSRGINGVVEGTSAKQVLYSSQHNSERADSLIAQTEEQLISAREGENKIILGAVLNEKVRLQSVLTIYKWALPYLSMYWDGIGSLRLLSERGAQLPMADMSRFFKGTESKRLWDKLKSASKDVVEAIPLAKTSIEKKNEETDEAVIVTEQVKVAETMTDRLAKYTAHTYFWTQIRGEMVTYNPTYGEESYKKADALKAKHEKLNISETMQQFVYDISNTADRVNPDEPVPLLKKINIYYDDEGNQIPEASANENTRKVSLFPDTLDYFNKTKTEDDRRWVIVTTAAMAIHDAKTVLDGLPNDIKTVAMGSPEWNKYEDLYKKVKATAIEMMENYDDDDIETRLAKTAFNLSYSLSFGSFSVADWGWSYEWEKKSNGLWKFEGSQGDPTASGDAMTAKKPLYHEIVYAAIKDRKSAPKGGPLMPIDGSDNGEKALELANALLSEVEQTNQKGEMLERIKKGEQLHIAKFFGVIGAYEKELHDASFKGTAFFEAWEAGAKVRAKASEGLPKQKVANPNLIKTIEKLIVYVPTPFKDDSGKGLVYPMLIPQINISLLDMLRATKYGDSAGDILRKTWKFDETTNKYEETPVESGGRRFTLQEINWKGYGPYSDDSRAVNNNFISQLYAPMYGAPNPKVYETITANPTVAIGDAVKAADISTRAEKIVVDESVPHTKENFKQRYAQRPSLEIMFACSNVFQNMALPGFGLLGRDANQRMEEFLKEISVGDKTKGKNDNLYNVLRNVEDLLPSKQEYDNYSDSFYLLFLAMTEAFKPITEASHNMSFRTTDRMDKSDLTGAKSFEQKHRNDN